MQVVGMVRQRWCKWHLFPRRRLVMVGRSRWSHKVVKGRLRPPLASGTIVSRLGRRCSNPIRLGMGVKPQKGRLIERIRQNLSALSRKVVLRLFKGL